MFLQNLEELNLQLGAGAAHAPPPLHDLGVIHCVIPRKVCVRDFRSLGGPTHRLGNWRHMRGQLPHTLAVYNHSRAILIGNIITYGLAHADIDILFGSALFLKDFLMYVYIPTVVKPPIL